MAEANILIVEDDEIVARTVERSLRGNDFKITKATSGVEGIKIASQLIPDLVILDVIMPGMEGGKVFETLKSIHADVKVILSSGYSINHEITGIMERGCQGFIQKPFDIGSFSKKIREVLAGGELQTPPPPADRYQPRPN